MYKWFIVGFKKSGGKKYQIRVCAENGQQAVNIAYSKLHSQLGEGDFYIVRDDEDDEE